MICAVLVLLDKFEILHFQKTASQTIRDEEHTSTPDPNAIGGIAQQADTAGFASPYIEPSSLDQYLKVSW